MMLPIFFDKEKNMVEQFEAVAALELKAYEAIFYNSVLVVTAFLYDEHNINVKELIEKDVP